MFLPGLCVGSIIGAIMMDMFVLYGYESCFVLIKHILFRFGRKHTLIIGIFPLIAGWILIGLAESVAMLYVARFISGLTNGIAASVVPMYLGEISSNRFRGAILTLFTVMNKVGYLFVYSIAPYVSIPMMAWIGLIPTVIFLLCSFWLPESPYFLIGKQRQNDAKKSLKRIKRCVDVDEELELIEEAVKKSSENKGTFKELMSIGNRRSLFIVLGLATLQPLTGSASVIVYAPMIFQRIKIGIGNSEASIMLAVIQLAASIVATFTIDKFGRRPLLLFSCFGLSIFHTCVTVYFFLERKESDINNLGWLPFVSIMAIMITYLIGLGTVPYALLGEIFPKHLKAFAGAIFFVYFSAVLFFVQKLFQTIADGLGDDVAFFIFAIFSFLSIPFIWFCVPETKGKSLSQILVDLSSKDKSWFYNS